MALASLQSLRKRYSNGAQARIFLRSGKKPGAGERPAAQADWPHPRAPCAPDNISRLALRRGKSR